MATERDDEPPRIRTGRIGRTAGVGGMVAGQGLRWAGTRLANVTRGDQRSQRATDDRVAAIAVQIARQLGEMKGAAMKIGQVLSTVEMPGLSEEGQEEFRAALAQLRDNAPTFGFDDIRTVIEADLGRSIEAAFAEFEPEAFAAASIGQVHRATTHEGEEVAVKVQYPGVAEAVEVDLRNLHLILRLVKRMAPGLDVKAVGGEVRERISEELDYELEAGNHRALERAFRGHPFAVVPRVHTALSGRRVLVTDYLEGARFDAVKEMDEATRDRYGEIVFRFFFDRERTLMILGDPHPGNYLLLADGKVGFLDFGMVRRIPREHFERERALGRAIASGDAADRARADVGARLPAGSRRLPARRAARPGPERRPLAVRARLPPSRRRLRAGADRGQQLTAEPSLRADEAPDDAARLAADATAGGVDLRHPRRPPGRSRLGPDRRRVLRR